MRILGIAGSLRRDSYNTAAPAAALALPSERSSCPRRPATIPPYNEYPTTRRTRPVRDLREQLPSADLCVQHPEYNASVPGCARTPSTGLAPFPETPCTPVPP